MMFPLFSVAIDPILIKLASNEDMHDIFNESKLCPPNRRGGSILFLVRLRTRCFVSAHYLLNPWMDFDQTCTDTLLGGRNELIRFW